MEAIVDSKGRPEVDSEGRPRVKTPNPRIELPYTYLMAWYVMHCPSLMTPVSRSEGFVPFVQRLESDGPAIGQQDRRVHHIGNNYFMWQCWHYAALQPQHEEARQ